MKYRVNVGSVLVVFALATSGCTALSPVRVVHQAPDASLRDRRVITMAPVDVGPAPTRTAAQMGREVDALAAHMANRDGLNLVVSHDARIGTQLVVRPRLVSVRTPIPSEGAPPRWAEALLRVEILAADGRRLETVDIEREVILPTAIDCAKTGWFQDDCYDWGRPADVATVAGRVLGIALVDYLRDRVADGV